jgi:hypothetical protein
MGFNSVFKGLKLFKTPRNRRLNNLNNPVLNVLTARDFTHLFISVQPLGRSGRNQSSVSDWYGSGTLHPGHVFRGRLPLLYSTFRRSHFGRQVPPRLQWRKRSQQRKWNCGQEMLSGNFAEMTASTPFRDLLHATNLRHETDSYVQKVTPITKSFPYVKYRLIKLYWNYWTLSNCPTYTISGIYLAQELYTNINTSPCDLTTTAQAICMNIGV